MRGCEGEKKRGEGERVEGLEVPDFGTILGEMTGEGMRGFVGEIEVSGWASRMKEKDKQNKLLAIQPLLPWCSLQRNDLHLIHPQYNHWIALMEIHLASM